jgi:hypothetical protein
MLFRRCQGVLVEEKLFQLDGLLMHCDITQEKTDEQRVSFFLPKKSCNWKKRKQKKC